MAVSLADSACPFLVQDKGRRVEDWEKSWATAVELAGADKALFHDLRRTALEISGHKTRSVFDRYHIVSDRRLKQLAEKMDAHIRSKEPVKTVTVDGDSENAIIH